MIAYTSAGFAIMSGAIVVRAGEHDLVVDRGDVSAATSAATCLPQAARPARSLAKLVATLR
jgi:hypothetical protein